MSFGKKRPNAETAYLKRLREQNSPKMLLPDSEPEKLDSAYDAYGEYLKQQSYDKNFREAQYAAEKG